MSKRDVSRWSDESTSRVGTLAYTSAEIQQFAEAAKGVRYGDALLVILYHFLRIAEALELRVKDIDIEHDVIHVRRQYKEEIHDVRPPKYVSRRDVPIMRECKDLLRDLLSGKSDEQLLFPGHISDGHLSQSSIREALEVVLLQTGLPRHTVHDLRHDGISRLVDLGVTPQSVSKWAGHKSLSFTLDRYYRHTSEENPADLALVVAC